MLGGCESYPKPIAAIAAANKKPTGNLTDKQFETPGILKGMPVHATFLDEVSWDIPHQNWGVK